MAKLVCTLEMSKDAGVTITVVNADDSITQTVTMDGTTLTLKVAGSDNTSTFTQTSDSIAIKCKDFSIDADNTITCTSAKATKHTSSEDVIALDSAKDMTLTAGGKLSQNADGDVEIAGANVTATGQSGATIKGLTAEVSGDQSLTLKGTAQAELSGSMVSVKADAQLSAESSGMATLGGNMTSIKGTLINAG